MSRASDQSPTDRFLQFMTADIEGDTQAANELAREMLDLKEVPPYFDELRRQLRICRSVEEMHKVCRSLSGSNVPGTS